MPASSILAWIVIGALDRDAAETAFRTQLCLAGRPSLENAEPGTRAHVDA